MKEKPILFSTEMIKSLLNGTKTQTRRICKPQPIYDHESGRLFIGNVMFDIHDKWDIPMCLKDNARWEAGDVLWVRETFYAYGHWTRIRTTLINSVKTEHHFHDLTLSSNKIYMYEDHPPETVLKRWGLGYHKRPSIFMPKEACRIRLEITDIRVERLQEISEEDAIAEGVGYGFQMNVGWPDYEHIVNGVCTLTQDTARMSYASLWDKINGKGSWKLNPWIWAITFKRL